MAKNRFGKEKIIFANPNRPLTDVVFNVEVAGETFPDPDYYIERDEEKLKKKKDVYNSGLYVLEYVKSGKGYIECEGKKYEVKAGDFYFLSPFAPHFYYSDKDDPFCKLFINISGQFVEGMVKGLRIKDCVRIKHCDIRKDMEYIHECLMNQSLSLSEKFDLVATRVCAILLLLKPHVDLKSTSEGVAAGIRQYIDENISSSLDLDTICGYFYISKSNLISIFQKEYGRTPHKYIVEQRIELAKRMLKDESLTVADISQAVGFEGVKYFYYAFKKATKVTPGQWRNLIKRDSKEKE